MRAQTPKYFNRKLGWGIFLLPFSLLFWLGGKIAKISGSPYKAKAKVICIGNIVVGGVGKTPLVIKVVEHYLKLGKRVAVISRGYGRCRNLEMGRNNIIKHHNNILNIELPIIVDYKKNKAEDVGDEPLMIARHFRGAVPVCICRNRSIGLQVLDAMGIDVVIADDGLQNYTFQKDKVVATFDGKDCIGNGWILPAGPMRETLGSGMKKVDMVVMMRQKNPEFEARLKKYAKPIFSAKTVVKNGADFAGKKVVAFAGIGKPEKFYQSLKGCGADVVATIDFPDHHNYTSSDIEKLVRIAKMHKAVLVTTEKDAVKIPAKMGGNISALCIDIVVEKEKEFFRLLEK